MAILGARSRCPDCGARLRRGRDAGSRCGAVAAAHSPQSYDRLRVLHTALEPLRDSAGAAELRGRLTAA